MSGDDIPSEFLNSDGFDIPGPVDWHSASHWIEYDHKTKTVETWCKTGPNYKYRLITRRRPMSEMEVLLSNMRGSSQEEIQRALGIWEEPKEVKPKSSWWKFWLTR